MEEEETIYVDNDDTLGSRLLDVAAGFVKGLWSSSYTVLTVDLKRASISYQGPALLRRQRQRRERRRSPSPPPGLVSSGHGYLVNEENATESSKSGGWGDGLEASKARARLKVMQIWEMSKGDEDDRGWRINLGIGGEFELDKGEVRPKLRLRNKHAALHLLPVPAIDLRRRWPLPTTLSTRLGIDVRCRIPIVSPEKMLESGYSGPRLMVNVYNIGGSGVHFTPGGLLFEDNVIELGKFTRMRVAAAIEFPRELPWSEEERPFKLEVRRVGIKARTL